MALMTSQEFRSITEPVINMVFDGLYMKLPEEWRQFFTVEKALPRAFEDDPILAGLGTAKEKQAGATITYDSGGQFYTVRYLQVVYALAFAMTEELIEDSDHIATARIYSEHLARGLLESKEIVHANVFNRAFDSNYPGGDDVSLLNTAHPRYDGGTFSNTLTTDTDLSETSLEQLAIQVMNAVDERNRHIALQIKHLIVGPQLVFDATRILNSIQQSGTANNDVNALREMNMIPGGIKKLTRLTETRAYYLQTNAPRGLIHKYRRPVRRGMEGDFETNSMRYKAHERYAVNHQDPRCLYGSRGTGG